MSIARLQELVLVGDADRKQDIMEGLQALGVVHLVPLADGPKGTGPDPADDYRDALLHLVNAPRKRRQQRPQEVISRQDLIATILQNKYARDDIIDRIELIRQKQRALAPWGNFELSDLGDIGGNRFWFYLVPPSRQAQLEEVTLPWKIVDSDPRFHYLVVVSPVEPGQEQVPFKRTHTGIFSLSELAQQREAALVELEDRDAERESLTRWIMPLTEARDQSLDGRDLRVARNEALDAQGCFVLKGWIPEPALPALEGWSETLPVAWQLREPGEEDHPPTLLQNTDLMGGGEEAVAFFQLPGYHAWDPSSVIFFSFALFFSMILADGGYALLLGGILLLWWRRLSVPGSTGIRIRNLWAALTTASFGYGALVGSWFGVTPGPGSLLASVHLLDMNDFQGMMRLSLGAGVLHLVVANGMVAWTQKHSAVALASVGWMLGIGSAFLLWLDYMGPRGIEGSHWTAGVGLGLLLILLFSGRRRIRTVKDGALQLFDGIKALYGVSRAFGDVLSYMRLFALGLSSASLAVTFNSLAVSARDSMDVGGFMVFALILLLGHTLNFALALMSGVIHGLRLNLLEFYNWGVQGEGYPFKAFAKRGGSRWNSL